MARARRPAARAAAGRRARARAGASRSPSTPAASAATRSCAASRARARPTRSACCSSSCCCETGLRIVVLDPNSDFVRLGERARRRRRRGSPSATAPPPPAIAVHRAGDAGRRPAAAPPRASSSRAAQAALLRLDPIARPRGVRRAGRAAGRPRGRRSLERRSRRPPRPEAQRLGLRARNLGVDRLGIWARDDPGSTLDAVEDRAGRCVVVDLGSLATPRRAVARRRRPCSTRCGRRASGASRC